MTDSLDADTNIPRMGQSAGVHFLKRDAAFAYSPEVSRHAARAARAGLYNIIGKRVLDIAIVALSLPVVVPLVAILILMVRLDGGPGLFGHRRVAKGGQSYQCWKIRSMVPDAENVLLAHLAADASAAAEWAQKVKLIVDPRITRIGRFLRKTSLDELPQLWNVLVGEMSIVGPRPVTRPELDRYGPAMAAYIAVRPGITGAWQVSGRNSTGYADRVALDVDYVRNLGLWLDFLIILRTFKTVLNRTGC